MRVLYDDTSVNSRSYYFLMDWNNNDNSNFIYKKFGKTDFYSLTIEEYMLLWLHATTTEYNDMVKHL